MKTTILGIEIGSYTVRMINEYIKANKRNKEEKTNYSGWNCGYKMAKAENALEDLKIKGKISAQEHKILYKFMSHVEFPETKKYEKLYSKGWC